MNFKKKIIILIAVMVVLIQFKQIDRTMPEFDSKQDYIKLTNAPAQISNLLKTSCYNCHSNEVDYPWYSYIAPVSWFLDNHIQDARKHINFSEWGTYPKKNINHKLANVIDEIKDDEMPLRSYTLFHSIAKLSEEDKATLIEWFSMQRKGNSEQD